MRLKVESVPPLPHVKAWFSANALPSVLDLKTSLCTDLHALKQGRVQPQDILLLLDDFELLDSSSIDVVRDGDLIVIKKRPASTAAKRKAPPESPAPARKRSRTDDARAASRKPSVAKGSNTIRPALAAASESSSDSDSDSDSDSSDDSSSDTDSDADSDSDASDSESSSDESTSSSSTSTSTSTSSSTSTSASSARPTIRRRQPKPANDAPKAPQPSKPAPPPVPPGLGKPATHSRNLRRRRKKMYERLSQTAEPASANAIPLGTRARTAAASEEPEQQPQPPTPTQVNGKTKGKEPERQQSGEAAPPAFMMASLQNKNKRRGFKNAMSQGVPAKIYFPDAAGSSSSSSSQAQHEEQQQSMDVDPDAQLVEAALQPHPSPPTTSTPSRPVSRAQPRLVPPSEKQALGQLPANVFVTSVDVEEGLWPARGKKTKKKKKKQVQVEEECYEKDTFAGGLPYDDPPEDPVAEVAVAQSKEPVAESTEHAVVAAQWDTLRKITDKSQLAPGATVGWKALGINFATLTPEMLLHIGRVIRCDDQLVVEPFAEPSVEELSFGGAVVAEEGGAAEETFEWPDVFSGDWRLVSAAR